MQRLSVNTVRKRIERIEHLFGQTLFRRTASGVLPTPAAEALVARAMHMRSAGTADLVPDENLLLTPGELRIACSETIGFLWLAPRVFELQSTLGGTTVFLQCDYDLARDRTAESDVSLQLFPAHNSALVSRRIATVHYMFHASRDYLERNGTPATLDDLRNFRMLELVAPGVRSDVLDTLIGSDRTPDFVPLRTNSTLSLAWAVANGGGIGALPTYVHGTTDTLVPIDLPFAFRRELYLVYHRDARLSPALKAAQEWADAAFDADRYPWFRSTFVHPRDVERPRGGRAAWLAAFPFGRCADLS
jgi:DNA-binding transcriptional LysR family regulator